MSIIHRILDILIFIADEEEQIEILKFEAFQQKNFSIAAAFMRIDQQQKGFVKSCDIQDFLSSNGFHSDGEASLKYISHYDIDEDEQLSLKEFERALLPQSSSLLKQDILKRPGYNVIRKLPSKLEQQLFDIIKRQIQFYHKLLTKLAMIWVDFKLDLAQIFEFIDKNKLGYITPQALSSIFQEFGYNLYKDQLQFIMNKFDLNFNGVITLRDFCNLLYISNEQAEDIIVNQQSVQEMKSENRSSHKSSHHKSFHQTEGENNNYDQPSQQRNLLRTQEKRMDSLNSTQTSRKRINSVNKSSYQPNNISLSYQVHLNDTFSFAKKRCSSTHRTCKMKQEYVKIVNIDLVTFLKFIQEYSKRVASLDQLKIQMISQPDLDATVIFSLFDKHQRGFLGKDDFIEGMYNIGLIPNNEELSLLFRRFKLESDVLQISFSEFAQIISPTYLKHKQNIYQKFEQYTEQKYEFLSYTSQTLLRDYFSCEIENQIYKSQYVQGVQKSYFVEKDLIHIISKIQTLQPGIITLKDLEKSFKSNGVIANINNIQLLFSQLNSKQFNEYERTYQQPNFNFVTIQDIVDEILFE